MALIHADFVEETSTTTGTGTLSLSGATTGNRTFVSAIGNGNTCIYGIAASNSLFESGIGTVVDGSPDTLERTTLLSSSTGSKLDLPAGTHRVYCTFAAEGGTKAYTASMITSGFVNRTDTTLAFASNTFTLGKVNNYRVWSNSQAFDFTADKTVAVPDVTGFYFIYINEDGDLILDDIPFDFSLSDGFVASFYYNSTHPTEYIIGEERHSYFRNPLAHGVSHNSIGAFWKSGLSGTFGDTNGSISIVTGTFCDEDIAHIFSGTTTQARIVYLDTSGWRCESLSSDIRKQAAGIIQWNNGTALSNVTASDYVCYWVYAANSGQLHILVGQQAHSTAAQAVAVVPDSLTLPPWLSLEARLLYKVIYQRTGGTPAGDIYQTPTDYRKVTIIGGTTLAGSFVSTSLPDSHILVGNSAGIATAVSMSGDASISNAGVVTVTSSVADGSITLAKLADLDQDKFICRTTTSTGVPETATVTSAARTVLDDTSVSAMVDTLGGASAVGTGGLVRSGYSILIQAELLSAMRFGGI